MLKGYCVIINRTAPGKGTGYIEVGGNRSVYSLMNVFSDETDLLDRVATWETIERMRDAMSCYLTEQERRIIVLRYGIGGGKITDNEKRRSLLVSAKAM